MLAELNRLDDRQLHHLLFSLERRVRSALAVGDAEITHDLLDEYLIANEEFDRRFSAWVVTRRSVALAIS
jgi:hypothetical protein